MQVKNLVASKQASLVSEEDDVDSIGDETAAHCPHHLQASLIWTAYHYGIVPAIKRLKAAPEGDERCRSIPGIFDWSGAPYPWLILSHPCFSLR